MDEKILFEILDIAIGGLIENEACSYCRYNYGDDPSCIDGSLCQNAVFDGLKREAERRLNDENIQNKSN